MATVTQISSDKDVYDFELSDEEKAELNGDGHYEVVFARAGLTTTGEDVSSRGMFASQGSCTVTVEKGSTFTDEYTVTDSDGHEVTGKVTFG